ncbi:Heavy metal-associated isoprenylated plant protein 41 [Cardamine amara subsp. amara]|uniref:Heavy metal-associated isoprenylated plant protein 41 n=1 Tax=Cardamine amara subsp. amara TaxID=228776 RepID=A0ABD0ZKP7_CARAN
MRELSKLTRYGNNDEDEEETWVNHYSSNHRILLVGEGDFSFSHSLAILFGSASNICASSLDSYDEVVRKYKKARSNLETLKRLGASLFHGVDATKLHFHPDLRFRRFDRVIFNFPHAGFHSKESDSSLIRKHRELVLGFFNGASHLVKENGEVHVSHKNKAPFCHWNLEELASRCFLALIQRVAFEKRNYPGYENKRGDGSRCDQPFFLGECSTFKFRLSRVAKEIYAEKVKWRELKCSQAEFEGLRQRPVSFDLSYHGDHNLRQVHDPLVQSREITSPLDPCYNQESRCSQFEDARFPLERDHARFLYMENFRYTERRSLLCQDLPFQRNQHRQEQFPESSVRLTGDGIIQRMLKRTSFPHLYTGESPERRHLLYQDFPVQASQEPLFQRFNRFSERRMLRPTSFLHPYTGESQERSLTRQSNLNIHPPKHWIL